jgi:hypothetical protein
MLTYDHFLPSYVFFALAGAWSLIYWQVSDPITVKLADLKRRSNKAASKPKSGKAKAAFSRARRDYWRTNLLGSLMIVVVACLCLVWVRSTQVHYELVSLQGWLIPGRDPTPPNECSSLPDKGNLTVILGDWAAAADKFPMNVIRVNNDVLLKLDRNAKGQLSISADIYDSDNNLVTEIVNNRFTIFAPKVFEHPRKDLSSLSVILSRDKEEVLSIRYLNPTAISIQGVFRHPGDPTVRVQGQTVEFNGRRLADDNICAANAGKNGAAFGFSGPGSG